MQVLALLRSQMIMVFLQAVPERMMCLGDRNPQWLARRFVWAFPFLFVWLFMAAVVYRSPAAITTVILLTALSFLPPGNVRFQAHSPFKQARSHTTACDVLLRCAAGLVGLPQAATVALLA